MHVNPYYFGMLALALLLCGAGRAFAVRYPRWRVIGLVGGILLAMPAVCYAAYYALHFDNAIWFAQWRSLPGTELLAAGAGFPAGVLVGCLGGRRLLGAFSSFTVVAFLVILVTVPYAKQWLIPANLAQFEDDWQDGVCRQSTGSSCGPASAATLLRAAGIEVAERDLARECFTTAGGTENWYLARAIRRRGCTVRYLAVAQPVTRLPYPAIAGTRVGGVGAGHFIAVLGETPEGYEIADPLVGRGIIKHTDISRLGTFTGFFMVVEQ